MEGKNTNPKVLSKMLQGLSIKEKIYSANNTQIFKVLNEIDGKVYARKKVTLRLNFNSKKANYNLEKVIEEVKILSLLSHPRILRYNFSWLECEEKQKNTVKKRPHTNARDKDSKQEEKRISLFQK